MIIIMFKQISVFVENKNGRLADVLNVLRDNGINIYAVHIADTTNFGILRFIVDKTEEAKQVIEKAGFAVKTTNVLAVGMGDEVGSLCNIINILKEENIPVEYLYAFAVRVEKNRAVVVIKTEDNSKAESVLKKAGYTMPDNNSL